MPFRLNMRAAGCAAGKASARTFSTFNVGTLQATSRAFENGLLHLRYDSK